MNSLTRAQFLAAACFGQTQNKLAETIPELLKQTGVPGLSVAIVEDAKVAWSGGFGVKNAEAKDLVNADTIFEAASLSKPAFAYVALKLVETGELSLDRPLSDYTKTPLIPNEPRLKLVTARTVLSHISGLPHGRPAGSKIALRFDPGSRFAYSSVGIEYLRAVVEALIKQPIEQFMKERLIDPFGMKNSSFGWQPRFHGNYATGNGRSGRIGLSGNGEYLEATPAEKQAMARNYPDYKYPSASAGLYTTAPDYARFLAELMQPGAEKITAQMCKPQTKITPSIDWGLGWGLEKSQAGDAFWHWGDWGVYRNFAIGNPKARTGIVVMTNSFHGPKAYQKIIGTNHPAFAWVDSYRP
jgi:CubicO group peptidase (beta-lactamase class C family)